MLVTLVTGILVVQPDNIFPQALHDAHFTICPATFAVSGCRVALDASQYSDMHNLEVYSKNGGQWTLYPHN